ncbi:MAG TPA: N-6 DNA methylase [Anaerovoracaceae bacterium]|nr:N-6 DNA methylase [Anaerovoracaceae bacterium]
MRRNSGLSSSVFVKNDLRTIKWNIKNPNKDPTGSLYTQQECLDDPEIGPYLGHQKPEYVVKVKKDAFWVIQVEGTHSLLDQAFNDAKEYAGLINQNPHVHAFIISGAAGNDSDGYLLKSAILYRSGKLEVITYNGNPITGLLSPDQALYLVENQTSSLNELVTDEAILMTIAENINEEFHRASINKDSRATVMSSILLCSVSDDLPNFSFSPRFFVQDINDRAKDVLISHSKRQYAEHIKISLPHEAAAQQKYKGALVKVLLLLRKINITAAIISGHCLLGKFYEVFLNYGNGAKDIGIVMTPSHVAKFACNILGVTDHDIVYDPACGTGAFLVAACDKVRNGNPQAVKNFIKYRIFGVEQQVSVAALAAVNMIIRGEDNNNIINNDCFSVNLSGKVRNGEISAEFIDSDTARPSVTKVLMNPPFALKKDAEAEYRFIDHALKQMSDDGLLFAVVPVSVMYGTGPYLDWRRRMLTSNTLVSVISFPNEMFYPQASVETIAIVIKRGRPHVEGQKVAWVRIEHDGFYKSKNRRLPTDELNQLRDFEAPLCKFIIVGEPGGEITGSLQYKEIYRHDINLELIPANYLDNQKIGIEEIALEAKRVFTEIIFQGLKTDLQNEVVEIVRD